MKRINGKIIYTEPLNDLWLRGKHNTVVYITEQAYINTPTRITDDARYVRNVHFIILKNEMEIEL